MGGLSVADAEQHGVARKPAAASIDTTATGRSVSTVEVGQHLRLGRRVERTDGRRERPPDPVGMTFGQRDHAQRLVAALAGVVEDQRDDAVDLGVGRVDRRVLTGFERRPAVDDLQADYRVEDRAGRSDERVRVPAARDAEEARVRIPVGPAQPVDREQRGEVLEQRPGAGPSSGAPPGPAENPVGQVVCESPTATT